MNLTEKKCVPCEGGVPPFDQTKIEEYVKFLPTGWSVIDGNILRKEFKFKGFPDIIAFVNKIALVAQSEGHHPDMEVHYSKLIVDFSTHAIGGLSENDFIMAAKIEQ